MPAHPYSLFDADGVQARLIFTPCPGTQEASLDEALASLQAAGATALITVMPEAELAANAAQDLGARCAAMGLHWFPLPVADDSTPGADFEAAWAQSRADIRQRLDVGERLAIHCKGGSGRTGLIAAVLLLQQGLPLEEVTRQVQALRPKALQHPLHVSWIEQFARRGEGRHD